MKIVWVNAWYDPGKEADAAKALIDQGADIIAQHTDSGAPLQVAEQRGMLGFGQATDMSSLRAQGAADRDRRLLEPVLRRARQGRRSPARGRARMSGAASSRACW